jgi:holo-[acyl-carrier protein] synthase
MKKNSSIHGIGNDIIEIERIRQSIEGHGLRMLNRLFTTKEQDYCLKHKNPIPHFAGRFSAKEAIVKALGTGIGQQIGWLDIEILNDESGKPVVYLSAHAKKLFNDPIIQISISHCREYATAIALWLAS